MSLIPVWVIKSSITWRQKHTIYIFFSVGEYFSYFLFAPRRTTLSFPSRIVSVSSSVQSLCREQPRLAAPAWSSSVSRVWKGYSSDKTDLTSKSVGEFGIVRGCDEEAAACQVDYRETECLKKNKKIKFRSCLWLCMHYIAMHINIDLDNPRIRLHQNKDPGLGQRAYLKPHSSLFVL